MSDSTPIPPGHKRCVRNEQCLHPDGPILPASTEFFPIHKGHRDGLGSFCHPCKRRYHQEWQLKNQAETQAYQQRYYESHRGETIERSRQWREANPERKREGRKQEYLRDRKQNIAKSVAWGRRNRQRRKSIVSSWNIRNPHSRRANKTRQLARKRSLPAAYNGHDWQKALSYWGYRCAVCGRLEDFWTVLAQDHWIALNDSRPDNPGTVPWNILPLCHARAGVPDGDPCCNNSKGDRNALTWLIGRYGEQKAMVIIKRIEDYFAWVK